ncbi:transketolase [Lactiplantibacillus plajomi]
MFILKQEELQKLQKLAAHIRFDAIQAIKNVGQGHIGGSLSISDLLAVLYGKQMKFNADDPNWELRDRLVLSKGHAGPALYSALAISGFFDEEKLSTLNKGGTSLPSHPDHLRTPGVDATTGSLGQGTSQAAGIATGLKLRESKNFVYLIVGEGELNEGQCWEAFQYIASNKLDNLIVIIDDNKKQLDGWTDDVIKQWDIASKMRSFGFNTIQVKGDNLESIDDGIEYLKTTKDTANCMVLDSVKGAGVPLFENMENNHSVKFNDDELNSQTDEALAKLQSIYEG